MDDEQGTLSRYGVQEYQCLKVSNSQNLVTVLLRSSYIDARQVENTDPNAREGGEFTDVSQVEKFELTREEYESRPGE